MRRFTPLLQILWLSAQASAIGCAAPDDSRLVDQLAAAADTTPGLRVDAESVLGSAWDTMWVIGPYYSLPWLSMSHPALRVANRTRVSVDEHAHVVVLMSGRQVWRAAEVPRSRVDFDLGERSIDQLPRRSAQFTVCRDSLNNRRVLAVAPSLVRSWIICPATRASPALGAPR